MESAEHYRKRAAEVRAEAAKVRDPELKRQFFKIAEEYEQLAAVAALNESKP